MPDLLLQLVTNPQSGYGLPPHWGWYIVLYFFLGGLAAGTYAIATLLDLVGDPRDRDAVRLGYLLAFPLVVVCGVLLILDLGKPLRFWHMLVQSENVPELLLKPWSPISLGTWLVTAFGLFSSVSFLGALVETERLRWSVAQRVDRAVRGFPRPLILLWEVLGVLSGFSLGGYTGVLVTGTSIPIWHNAWLMGALFLLSAASSSYALLRLMLMYRGRAHDDPTVRKLARGDRSAILLEIVVLTAMLLLLGGVARPLIAGGFGVIFWLGVVIVGQIAPLALHGLPWGRLTAERRTMLAAACLLVGGLCLRFVIVMAPQYPSVSPWAL